MEEGLYSPHQLKFTIRGDKANGTRSIKIVEPHALVETAVVQLDSIASPSVILVDHQFVV